MKCLVGALILAATASNLCQAAVLPAGNPASTAPIDLGAEAQGVICFFQGHSFQVDTSGVLKGKTITAIASSGEHFLTLCSDGTMAAWGQNVYGQLGNGRHGADALSLAPVLVDETGALKGKTVTSIGVYENGSYALCSDGSLYTWGLPPLNIIIKKSEITRFIQDKPALFDLVALRGKKVAAVSTGQSFSVLCSDGSLFRLGSTKGSQGLVAIGLSSEGVLKGKKIALIGDGNKALCVDGTLVRWDPILVRQVSSVEMKVDPVNLPDQTGVLKGKTISAFVGDRVLCSDGTVADLWSGDVGHGTDDKNLYPQRVNLTVPAGQKITAIVGNLCLYSGGTLGFLSPPSGQNEAANSQRTFVEALKGKNILAIAPYMVLFKEPAASRSSATKPANGSTSK